MNKIIVDNYYNNAVKTLLNTSNKMDTFLQTYHGENEFIFKEFILELRNEESKTTDICTVILKGEKGIYVKNNCSYMGISYDFYVEDITDFFIRFDDRLDDKAENNKYIDYLFEKIILGNAKDVLLRYYMPRKKWFCNYEDSIFDVSTPKGFIVEFISGILCNIAIVMYTIMEKAKERALAPHKVIVSTTNKVRNKVNNKSTELKQVRTDNKIFLFDEIVEYASMHEPQHTTYEYHCECWEVRGHYRKLKDGRIVFVKPYKKGKNRDSFEANNKVYFI